jgi:hypothetical protein
MSQQPSCEHKEAVGWLKLAKQGNPQSKGGGVTNPGRKYFFLATVAN